MTHGLTGQDPNAGLDARPFGQLPDGQTVELYTLRLENGVQASISNYGARIVELLVPDREGRVADVVLGFDDAAGYLEGQRCYVGCVAGRYAGRIAQARFRLEGREHVLLANEGRNHLHGGPKGFDQALWRASAEVGPEGARVTLRHTSPDGDGGYPGTLECSVVYTLSWPAGLRVDYTASTDAPTVLNLTQHSYFNLAGDGDDDVRAHELTVAASRFACLDAERIPTGELRGVEGTPFDFRAGGVLGAGLAAGDEQLTLWRGYDHSLALDGRAGRPRAVARLREPKSGRVLELSTSEPALQLYTGQFLDGSLRGKRGRVLGPYAGVCLETQHFSDSPNRPGFPATVLRPGETFHSTTAYRFKTDAPSPPSP